MDVYAINVVPIRSCLSQHKAKKHQQQEGSCN